MIISVLEMRNEGPRQQPRYGKKARSAVREDPGCKGGKAGSGGQESCQVGVVM